MFRSIWLAILASNIGTWVNDVAAAWVMAERTGSPLMVALVQSATTVPIVLLALAAGTLADIVDRRRYLLATQGWMLLVAAVMAALTAMDMLTPQLLVLLTFAWAAVRRWRCRRRPLSCPNWCRSRCWPRRWR